MIIKSELSKKYAQAYFNLYVDSIKPSSVQSLQDAADFLSHSKELLFLLDYGALNSQEVDRCIQLFINKFQLPVFIEKLFMLLLEQNRIFLIGLVLHDICCLYKQHHNELDVTLSSVQELSPEQIEMLSDFFAFYSQSKINLTVVQDKSLIAGIRMQSEVWLWEDSVAKVLRTLKQNVLL
jgi:ATP synthase F1 delta subunit